MEPRHVHRRVQLRAGVTGPEVELSCRRIALSNLEDLCTQARDPETGRIP